MGDRRDRNICARQDHVHLEAHQLARELWKSFGSGLAIARLQDESFPFDMALFPQPLPERLNQMCCGGWTARHKQPDLRDLRRLFRINRRARCGDGKDQDRDAERSPAH